ncbi:MAG: tetratricopeptide repeat protein [Polyangiales bacterium]
MNEGVVFAQQNRHLDAVERLEKAVAIDPTNDQAYYNLGLVHIDMQKFERAKDDFERAIAANGEVAGYHEKLGTAFIELEAWPQAKEALEKALKLDSTLFKGSFKLAQVLEQLDDPQNALYKYTEAIKRGPRFLEAYASLGSLYADLGYPDHAIQVLRGGLQVAQPNTEEEANLHHLLGTVYQQQNDLGKAVEHFRQAVKILPGMQDALFSLGWTYSLQDRRQEARRYLQRFVEVAGAQTEAHYIQAAKDRLAELNEDL